MASIFSPFFLSDRALRREIRDIGADMSGLLLDLGCGHRPYQSFFPRATYVGAEVRQASEFGSAKTPDLWFDGTSVPFADGTLDNVLCTQVLEHVFAPDAFLSEINRVLRPGGSLLITVPFVWDEHEQPYDFARYSSFGLAHLAQKHGFVVRRARRTLGDASIFLQLWTGYWYKVLRGWPGPIRKPLVATLSAVCNLVGLVFSRVLPASPDLYLDNVMLWQKS